MNAARHHLRLAADKLKGPEIEDAAMTISASTVAPLITKDHAHDGGRSMAEERTGACRAKRYCCRSLSCSCARHAKRLRLTRRAPRSLDLLRRSVSGEAIAG
jgi:hypothetical protein